MPIIGFFVDTNTPQWQPKNTLHLIVILPMVLPWWCKIISILVGIFWIAGNSETNNTPKDRAGLR